MRGPLEEVDPEGGGEVAGWEEVGGVEFVEVLGFFSARGDPPLLKNIFCSVRRHAIKDLSIRYASSELHTNLRKQYNHANWERP
jgi:hypothetical protein